MSSLRPAPEGGGCYAKLEEAWLQREKGGRSLIKPHHLGFSSRKQLKPWGCSHSPHIQFCHYGKCKPYRAGGGRELPWGTSVLPNAALRTNAPSPQSRLSFSAANQRFAHQGGKGKSAFPPSAGVYPGGSQPPPPMLLLESCQNQACCSTEDDPTAPLPPERSQPLAV